VYHPLNTYPVFLGVVGSFPTFAPFVTVVVVTLAVPILPPSASYLTFTLDAADTGSADATATVSINTATKTIIKIETIFFVFIISPFHYYSIFILTLCF